MTTPEVLLARRYRGSVGAISLWVKDKAVEAQDVGKLRDKPLQESYRNSLELLLQSLFRGFFCFGLDSELAGMWEELSAAFAAGKLDKAGLGTVGTTEAVSGC